jgi:hypothetical protein
MTLNNIIINRIFSFVNGLLLVVFTAGCEAEDPVKEDTPELITKATLTFTPATGTEPVIVSAIDPDGEGVQDLAIDGPINLAANQSYELSITLVNGLLSSTEPGYDITKEVKEEGDEHLFFFGWTGVLFADPEGNGNIDKRLDDVNYNDEDVNGFPVGLKTQWTTTSTPTSGTLTVVLKHQPELKTENSESSAGETDLNISFEVNIL